MPAAGLLCCRPHQLLRPVLRQRSYLVTASLFQLAGPKAAAAAASRGRVMQHASHSPTALTANAAVVTDGARSTSFSSSSSSSSSVSHASTTAEAAQERKKIPTAAIIVIGDEILKGQTQDTNTHFLTQQLHSLGITVVRVSVIPDEIDVISAEVRQFADKYDVVFTSGGIGPTHDDVTFEGVASAFSDCTQRNAYLADLVEKWFQTKKQPILSDDSPVFKLAQVPRRAKLNFGVDKETGERALFPVVSVENVYVFPGIPQLLRKGFNGLRQSVFEGLSEQRFHTQSFFVNLHESSLVSCLNRLVSSHSQVTVGSYPEWSNNYYKTKITAEAAELQQLQHFQKDIEGSLPTMPGYDPNPLDEPLTKIQSLRSRCLEDDESFVLALDEALEAVNKCLDDYTPEELVVCFNGGKDCIVMLHLVHAVFKQRYKDKKLQAIYIRIEDEFPEVTEFITRTEKEYDLNALNLNGKMKAALKDMLVQRPSIKATVLGTRMGDPGAKHLDLFSPTDGDWPKLMRVNPVLNWEYRHIWKFLRSLSVPYPSLYDQGYTSLGCVKTTVKNPALKYIDEDGQEKYKPAHQLEDGSHERAGRNK